MWRPHMRADAILNADMATVARWLRKGWRWWLDELAGMIPSSWRADTRRPATLAFHDEYGALEMLKGTAGAPRKPREADLALPFSSALMRELALPKMSTQDLRNYVNLEARRLFPFAEAGLLVDAEMRGEEAGAAGGRAQVAALHRETALAALADAQRIGLVPQRVVLMNPAVSDQQMFDFAPQLRAEGLLPPRSQQRMLWWTMVGAAAMLNIGLLVWRDQQSVARLQAAVDAQAPAIAVYRAIAGRSASIEQAARETVKRRAHHNALGDLAATTSALPDSAWVQRYDWDGRALRIAGYLRPPTDVVAALGKSERYTNVRPSAADVQADIPIGQPFDISADIVAGKP